MSAPIATVHGAALAELEGLACRAAQAAGAILRRRYAEGPPRRIENKGTHDFVTDVDREAEAAVLATIRGELPDDAIMSEEGSPRASAAGPRWVIDPLDGTTNFIHGVPAFAVSVALEDARGIVAGAIHDPLRDETFHARLGGGAWLGDRPIRTSARATLGDALIATGFPFRELSRVAPYLVALEAFIRSTAGVRRAGSACLDLAYTACGRYDGFWEVGLSRWDIAAGVLLVTEAGGRVSDVRGGASHLDTGDIVAAGAALHGLLVEVTSAQLG